MRDKKIWQTCRYTYLSDPYGEMLDQGWEPFAVTQDEYGDEIVWMRRQVVRQVE